jgi:hypothetical protein
MEVGHLLAKRYFVPHGNLATASHLLLQCPNCADSAFRSNDRANGAARYCLPHQQAFHQTNLNGMTTVLQENAVKNRLEKKTQARGQGFCCAQRTKTRQWTGRKSVQKNFTSLHANKGRETLKVCCSYVRDTEPSNCKTVSLAYVDAENFSAKATAGTSWRSSAKFWKSCSRWAFWPRSSLLCNPHQNQS